MPISSTRRTISAALVARAESGGVDLVSLMVRLHCRTVVGAAADPGLCVLLFQALPAARCRRSGAAGSRRRPAGCMLIRTDALDRIGGVDSIRHEIIDDCALARRVKSVGKIRLGASNDTVSIREYGSWRCDLGHDRALRLRPAPRLFGAGTGRRRLPGMALIYLAPPFCCCSRGRCRHGCSARRPGPVSARPLCRCCASIAFRLCWRRCVPLAALFYTAATIGSAIQYWRGRGGALEGPLPGRPGTLRRAR